MALLLSIISSIIGWCLGYYIINLIENYRLKKKGTKNEGFNHKR